MSEIPAVRPLTGEDEERLNLVLYLGARVSDDQRAWIVHHFDQMEAALRDGMTSLIAALRSA